MVLAPRSSARVVEWTTRWALWKMENEQEWKGFCLSLPLPYPPLYKEFKPPKFCFYFTDLMLETLGKQKLFSTVFLSEDSPATSNASLPPHVVVSLPSSFS